MTGLPALGEIGRLPRVRKRQASACRGQHLAVHADRGGLPAAPDRHRLIATKPFRSLLVTSSAEGEGKTTVASHLAASFAQAGWRVVALDADLRHPALHRQFSLPNTVRAQPICCESCRRGLDLSSRPRSRISGACRGYLVETQEPLTPANLRQVLDRLKDGADIIVVDGPSLIAVADSAMLAASADTRLLVVAWGSTTPHAVLDARDALLRARARVLGTVMNGVRRPRETRDRGRAARDAAPRARSSALSKDPPASG